MRNLCSIHRGHELVIVGQSIADTLIPRLVSNCFTEIMCVVEVADMPGVVFDNSVAPYEAQGERPHHVPPNQERGDIALPEVLLTGPGALLCGLAI